MKGQLSFIEPEFIRDSDCSVLTLVKLGKLDEPVYGMRKHISPRIAGRTGSSHFERIYLNKLFPLEEYDLIVIYDIDLPCGADCGNNCDKCIIQKIMDEYAEITQQVK